MSHLWEIETGRGNARKGPMENSCVSCRHRVDLQGLGGREVLPGVSDRDSPSPNGYRWSGGKTTPLLDVYPTLVAKSGSVWTSSFSFSRRTLSCPPDP